MSDTNGGMGYAADAPPTEHGEFVAARPPESWPTVIGVLSIIFGALGVLGNACSIVTTLFLGSFAGMVPEEDAAELEAQLAQGVPYPGLTAGVAAGEFVISILLLVGGILLLMRKRQGVPLLKAFAWLDLLMNTLGVVLSYFTMQAQMQAAQNDPNMQQMLPGPAAMMQGMGSVMLVLGWLFSAVWPVFLIVWFSRQRIRDAVDSWE